MPGSPFSFLGEMGRDVSIRREDNWRLAGMCIWNKCGKRARELARDGKGMLSMSEALFSASFCPVALKDKHTALPQAPLRVFSTTHHGSGSYAHVFVEAALLIQMYSLRNPCTYKRIMNGGK